MNEEYLLGIDIGTSSCKVTAFTLDGTPIFQHAQPYPTYYPEDDCVEQNPDEWWRAVCVCTRRMFAETGIKPNSIKGIGVAGQSWGVIPVSRDGKLLRNCMIWLDKRAKKQCDILRNTIGEETIFSLSGNPLSPSYSTPKILWIKENEPEIYRQAYKILQTNSYIVLKLTGKFTQDVSQGYGIHAFDIEKGVWDYDMCEQMGIDPEKLPDIYECSSVVGEVTASAAKETGLAKGTPVVAGGLDASCGTLGAGAIHEGETQEQGGQAGGMSIVLDKVVKHPKLILGFHVISRKWLLQGGTVGGGSLNWFKRVFSDLDGANFFERANAEAEMISPGSEGLIFLPYMAGERSPIWDVHAKGVFLGLTYDKTRGHMIRAIMEGCAFALKHNLITAEESGIEVGTLHSIGGAANSSLWTQIKSDVTGKTVKIPSSDTATTLGAAILAGVGMGIYSDFEDAVRQTVHFRQSYEPITEHHVKYQKIFEIYLESYEKLKELFPRLGRWDSL